MFMKRSELHERQCSTFVSCIVILISLRAVVVVGVTDFKPNLPSTILVQQGNSAVFPWDYTVDNKLLEFNSLSPRWSYYNSSGYEFRIGQENRIKNWAWEITNETCPDRLLYPVVRVSKTSVATLVIQNVGLEDAGIYGCTLVLTFPKTSKMRLAVSVTPQINLNETKHILEHYNLTVTCSANGPPTPNVTWIRNGNELAFGANGSAVLKIYRIKRYQHGKYYCKANNNPKEMSVAKEIDVTVEYPVECNETHSSKLVTAYLGQEIKLKTVADGVPIPTHVWYSPKKMKVYSEDLKESTYTITKVADKDFGSWTVNITNGIHSYYCVLTIEVMKALTNLTTTLTVDGASYMFSEEMKNTSSFSFKDFSIKFEDAIRLAYIDEENFKSVEVVTLRKGSINVTFVVFFKKEMKYDQACAPLEKAIENGKLGSFKIVPGSLGCSKASPPSPPSPGTGVHPGIIAGVAVVGVLAIAGLIIAVLFVCRKKSPRKDYRSSTGGQGVRYEIDARYRGPEEQYASVQRPAASGAKQSNDQRLPQYAAVDKSKKTKKKTRDPDELVYADLDHNASMDTRPPSVPRPVSGSDTVYADIQSGRQKPQYPPPQYGNILDISHA